MQFYHRWAARLGLVVLGLALVGLLASRGTAQKVIKGMEPVPQPTGGTGTAANMSSVKIQEDARFRQVLNVGRDCIKDKEWKQGVEALQTILNLEKRAKTATSRSTSRTPSIPRRRTPAGRA